MEKGKPVGIWIRVSTEDQARGESPDHHEKRARYYAESKDWHVMEVYHLEAVSGKSVMKHPEAQRMLADIRAGHITGLIFSKLARLARNTKELLEFAEIFNEYGADLVSLQEAIDTSTPAGRLFYTMIAAMAQWEREEIASRVAASVPIRAKLGKPLGGPAPYGYRWVDKILVPDPIEAPIRKLIYDLFLEYHRKKTVARLLNEQGHRTRNGSKFSFTTIRRLLEDPLTKGVRRTNYSTKSVINGKSGIKPKDDWVYIEVEPIVSEEVWNQCNQILDEQRKKSRRPARRPAYIFSGIVLCACGGKIYVPSNSPKYTCAKCRNKIGVEDLEEIYHEQLKTFFFSPTEINSYLAQADQVIKEKEELLQSLIHEEQKLQREMDKIFRLYLDEEIPSKGFGARYKPMEERQTQIQDQIPELQAEIDFLKIQYLSSDEIMHEAKDLHSRWPQLAKEEKRKIIENITEQIIIGENEIVINLCYLPTASELMTTRQQNSWVPATPAYEAISFVTFMKTSSRSI